jgi:hypothetical protein
LSTCCPVADGDADDVRVDGAAAEVDVGVAAGVPPPDDPLQAEHTRTSNATPVVAMEGLIPRASMQTGQIATGRPQP